MVNLLMKDGRTISVGGTDATVIAGWVGALGFAEGNAGRPVTIQVVEHDVVWAVFDIDEIVGWYLR